MKGAIAVSILLLLWFSGIYYVVEDRDEREDQIDQCIIAMGPVESVSDWCEAIVETKGEWVIPDDRWLPKGE